MPRTDHPEDSEALAGSIAATAGDRTLSGLQGTAAQSTAAAAQAGGHDPKLNEIIEKMVDRILVSEPKAGESKVMIRMNAPSLEGTEITLSRDAGGLTVRIEAPPDVAQRLSQGQHVLQQMLENKTTGPVQVEVGTRSDGGTEDNQDGRSRNRRDIREEQEDAE